MSLVVKSAWDRSVFLWPREQVASPSGSVMLRAEGKSAWSHLGASQPRIQTLGSSWQGLLGSGPEAVSTSFHASPPFPPPLACSPLRGAAALTLIPWGKKLLSWTQGLSPRGRGVFRAMTRVVPVRVLCTEVTCRVPPLITGGDSGCE